MSSAARSTEPSAAAAPHDLASRAAHPQAHGEASTHERGVVAVAQEAQHPTVKGAHSKSSLFKQLKRAWRRFDMLFAAGSTGAVAIVVSIIFGYVLQRHVGDQIVGDFSDVETIPKDYAAYAIAPWDAKNCNMFLGAETLAIFVLRRYVFEWLTSYFYPHMPANKRTKIANYMLELCTTNAAIVISQWSGLFHLLVKPSDFRPPTVGQGELLFIGSQQLTNIFLATYVVEMCFDRNIRTGLAMHHWAVFLLCIWGVSALYTLGYDIMMTRTFFCLSLYVSTEQNVFVEMLLYQQKIYLPRLFNASGWYYLISRTCIAIYVMECWWDMFDDVFKNHNHNCWIAYSMWVAIPFINLILNTTQLTTVFTLFGIAREVKRRCKAGAKASLPQIAHSSTADSNKDKTMRSLTVATTASLSSLARDEECGGVGRLVEVFADVDEKQRGYITLLDWMQYVAGVWTLEPSIPLSAFEEIFSEMLALSESQPGVTATAFINYVSQYAIGGFDFDTLVLAIALQKAHAAARGDATLRAILRTKHTIVMQGMLRQHRQRLAAKGASSSTIAKQISGSDTDCVADSSPFRMLGLLSEEPPPTSKRCTRAAKTWSGPMTLPLEVAEV